MTGCVVCQWIEQKKNVLFEDDSVFVILSPEPSSPGNMLVVPKKHFPIIESIPDDLVGKLFLYANKASVCAFESLGAQGANILVQNGVPAGQKMGHCVVQVIPRFQDDKLRLSWQPKQLSAEQREDLEQKFKAEEPKRIEGEEDRRAGVLR